MKKIDNIVYTDKTHTTGEREGFARSDDAPISALTGVSRSALPSGMLRIRASNAFNDKGISSRRLREAGLLDKNFCRGMLQRYLNEIRFFQPI
ncbi:hypothetical protein [Mesorhizobium sp.]|uniref:hypothetical protein n=1 Tax=Mesorhizobium sp. TaxID=1871066 RepID=UPI0025D3D5ED|nr:hypothetical protein [Mesorhizobium sp.]